MGAEVSGRAARPRDAASLVVYRQAGSGFEVLMGVRAASHRFMPGRLVFPGGAVDPSDQAQAVRAPLRAATCAALLTGSGPRLGQALAVAALREAEEETGLRLRLEDGFDLGDLAYLARVVTPPDQPIRFNARFLALRWNEAWGEGAPSSELERVAFLPIELARAQPIPRPTRAALEVLGEVLEGAPEQAWLVVTWPGQRPRPGERTRPEPQAGPV